MTTIAMPESRFLTVNGLQLHHLDWGNASAPALVFVHGFRSNAHAFNGAARHLRDHYHVIATDVRGRGDSAWSPDAAYDFTDYVSDLEGVVDGLGLEKFTLVGTSMGGRIAMYYAGKHPERLERLVINDIGPDREAGSDRITREAASTPDSFADLEGFLEYRRRTVPSSAALSHDDQVASAMTLLKQGADGSWTWKHDPAFLAQRSERGAQSTPELWDVLRNFQPPTLLLWGTISDVLSEAQAKKVVETLPNGSLAVVNGVGHAPNLTEPDAVAALDHFLGVTATA